MRLAGRSNEIFILNPYASSGLTADLPIATSDSAFPPANIRMHGLMRRVPLSEVDALAVTGESVTLGSHVESFGSQGDPRPLSCHCMPQNQRCDAVYLTPFLWMCDRLPSQGADERR